MDLDDQINFLHPKGVSAYIGGVFVTAKLSDFNSLDATTPLLFSQLLLHDCEESLLLGNDTRAEFIP